MGCCQSEVNQKYELEAASPDVAASPPSSEPASIALSDGNFDDEYAVAVSRSTITADHRENRAISYVSTASSVSGVQSTTMQRMAAASVILPPAPGIATLGKVMEMDAEDGDEEVTDMEESQNVTLLHMMARDKSFGDINEQPVDGISMQNGQSNLTKALRAAAGDM